MFTLFTYTPVMDEVSLKLMHDVETNPGPCCSRVRIFCKSTLIFLTFSGWLPWCGYTWFPTWSSPQRHRLCWSSREAFWQINLHLWRSSTLQRLHWKSDPSFHWPRVSWCWRQGIEGCAGSSKASGGHHMGGCEQALDSGEARRAASKLVFDNNIQVGYIWGVLGTTTSLKYHYHL